MAATRDPTSTSRRRLPRWLLLVLALAALIVGVRVLAGLALHTSTPWVVTEGTSMWPTVRQGELALIEGVSPRSLHRGEIVAVRVPPNYQRVYPYPPVILHRIRRVFRAGGQLRVVTQGDHNRYPDPLWFPAADVQGRLVRLIPDVGFLPLFVESRYGLIAVGGLLFLGLLYWLVMLGLEWAELSQRARALTAHETGVDLGELTRAIHAYGQHLASHTESVQAMAASARALQDVVERQTRILTRLEQWFDRWSQGRVPPPPRDVSARPEVSFGAGAMPSAPPSTVPARPVSVPSLGADPAGLLPAPDRLSWSAAAVSDLKRLKSKDAGRVLRVLERRGRRPVRPAHPVTVLEASGFSIWLHATEDGWQVERVVPDRLPPGAGPEDLVH